MDCIFCKIVAGKSERSMVYEDEKIFAFMDIQPVNPGQVLIIPKEHVDKFSDVSDEIADKIFHKARELVNIIKQKLNPDRVGLVVNGYGVSHAHMIVIPLNEAGDITTAKAAAIENGKVVFSTKNFPLANRVELDKLAKILTK
jgi:histidine triad (HIT) family protein